MRLIVAIIQPTRLAAVQDALSKIGVDHFTVCDAHGYGQQLGQPASYRGAEYITNLLRKVELEIVVNDDFVDRTLETLQRVARSGPEGKFGDGKVFVLPVEEAVRIHDRIQGPEAVS